MKPTDCVFLALLVLADAVDIQVSCCALTEISKRGTETKTSCAQLFSEGCQQVFLQPGEEGSLRTSRDCVVRVTVSGGCVLQLRKGDEKEAGAGLSLKQGEYTTGLVELLKEPASVYHCHCGQPETRARSKRATHEDFLRRHLIYPSPVPNTNQDWTQLMQDRGIFGRPFNTFLHGEMDQVMQAFDLQDKKLQYKNRVGLVHWSKNRMPTTNVRLMDNEYVAVVRARMKYVAMSFRNGLPVHLDKVSSRPPQT
nr:PREDICTED: uncharacterized protein LOC107076956 [Lepisosteus oculatus]